MTNDDFDTMLEMALEMTWVEASRFIRDEQGVSLMEGIRRVESLAGGHPDSPLARNFATRERYRGPSPA